MLNTIIPYENSYLSQQYHFCLLMCLVLSVTCVYVGASGVLLPGQEFSFPFVFKSSGAGIFTEAWALQTCPMLAGGQLVRVTLRGVAFREDVNKQKREDLEVCELCQ